MAALAVRLAFRRARDSGRGCRSFPYVRRGANRAEELQARVGEGHRPLLAGPALSHLNESVVQGVLPDR